MRRMTVFLALACACALSLAGCAKDAQTSKDAAADNTVQAEPETIVEDSEQENDTEQAGSTESEPVYEYPAEDAGPVLEESRLGYSMTFDPTVFTLDDTGEGSDIYTYHTAETLEGPAYIAVQSYPDMDAQTLADGLALQSGQDGVAVQDTYFGAEGLDTKCVYYEQEVNGVTQALAFYAVPADEGSLLVEICGYVGMPQQIEAKFEEMQGTFTLNQD